MNVGESSSAASFPDPCGLIWGEDFLDFPAPTGGAGAAVVVTAISLLLKGKPGRARSPTPVRGRTYGIWRQETRVNLTTRSAPRASSADPTVPRRWTSCRS